jgi:hypothetical protein
VCSREASQTEDLQYLLRVRQHANQQFSNREGPLLDEHRDRDDLISHGAARLLKDVHDTEPVSSVESTVADLLDTLDRLEGPLRRSTYVQCQYIRLLRLRSPRTPELLQSICAARHYPPPIAVRVLIGNDLSLQPFTYVRCPSGNPPFDAQLYS